MQGRSACTACGRTHFCRAGGGVGAARQELDALFVAQLSKLASGVALPMVEPPARQAQCGRSATCMGVGVSLAIAWIGRSLAGSA